MLFALRHKFHDPKTSARYMPQGQMARDLYDAMETARIEAVGAQHMPGTAGNIDAKIGNEALRKGYDQIRSTEEAPAFDCCGLPDPAFGNGPRSARRCGQRDGDVARVHRRPVWWNA